MPRRHLYLRLLDKCASHGTAASGNRAKFSAHASRKRRDYVPYWGGAQSAFRAEATRRGAVSHLSIRRTRLVVQHDTEEIAAERAIWLREKRDKPLCLAGGVSLNCLAMEHPEPAMTASDSPARAMRDCHRCAITAISR